MAQLYFKYGAMGSSKSANALMARFNYEERGQETLLVKPQLDTRDGDHMVRSRIGLEHPCIYFHEMQQMPDEELQKYACIIVDEAQFLTKEEVYYLVHLVDDCGIPVICYGLKADFKGELFPGSYQLLVLKKFVRNLSFMEQSCVRVAAIVVSEIIERLSPNIAPLMTAPMHMAREIEVFSLIPTAIGASAEIVPTLVPMDMERKQPIINSPAADQLAGSSFNPKFTVCSTPPAADTAPENAPAVRKIRHMVIIFSSASPLAMTVIFSENESVRVCKNAVSRAAKKAIIAGIL